MNCNSLDRWIVAQAAPEGTEAMMTTFFFGGRFHMTLALQRCDDSLHVFCAYVQFMIVILGFLGSVSGLKLVELQAATAMVVSEVKEIARSLGRELQGSQDMPRCSQADNQKLGSFLDFPGKKNPVILLGGFSCDKLWVYEKKSGGLVFATDCTDFISMCPPEGEPPE